MSAEKIIQQIKKDSEKEISEIKKEAEKHSKEILDSAKNEAKEEAEKIISSGKNESENIKRILISKANQENKKEAMKTRERIIDDCFVKAHHKLSILKGKEYEKLIKKLMQEGHKKIGSNCIVYASRDEDKKIAKDLGISVDGTVESAGGIILKSKDGRTTLDYTFNGILKREKDRIRIKVGKLLFS
jgi:vacuolar-type H+-ATPase subunit E/Vma4